MAATPHVMVSAAGRDVRITSRDKVFFSRHGETKLDLVEYYLEIEAPLMAAMGGRPTLMQRFPDGASGKSFFQKRVPKGAPEWLETTVVSTPNGTTSNAMVVADVAHIVWAVNMGCLGFHPWPFLASDPRHSDELRIDLDPGRGVSFEMVAAAAVETKTLLDELHLRSYVKSSGSRGLHVYVRLASGWDSYDVRTGAVALARELERRRPDLVTAAWWKEQRGERVFIDYNQNAPHKTVFGPWCVRPRVAAQVSAPICWDDLAQLHPDDLTLRSVPERLRERGNPWADMNGDPQTLDPLLDLARRDRDAGLGDAPWPPQYPKMPHEPSRVAPSRARR